MGKKTPKTCRKQRLVKFIQNDAHIVNSFPCFDWLVVGLKVDSRNLNEKAWVNYKIFPLYS